MEIVVKLVKEYQGVSKVLYSDVDGVVFGKKLSFNRESFNGRQPPQYLIGKFSEPEESE